MLTEFPSTTPLGLALGPDSPFAVKPSEGTLEILGRWILRHRFVTQSNILTSNIVNNFVTKVLLPM